MKYTNRHLPNITKYIDGSQSGFIFKTSNKSGSLVFKNDDFIFGLQDGTEINLRSLSSADPNTTLQGNTFNGAEQLVQTDTDGIIPESVLPTTVTLAGNEFNGANQLLQLDESGLIEDSNLSSNATLQGNSFNGADELLQLDATGDVPVENLPSTTTLQGNTFNGASQLVQLNSSGQLPALDGSNLTDINITLDADDISDDSTVNKFTTQTDIDKLAGIEDGATVSQITRGSNGSLYRTTEDSPSAGDTRGTYAVDLMGNKTSTDQIASGDHSGLFCGKQNRVEGTSSTVSSGFLNIILETGTNSAILTGYENTISGEQSSVLAGENVYVFGNNATASGLNNRCRSYCETVLGMNALNDGATGDAYVSTDPIFRIGNGVDSSNLSEALRITKDGSTFLYSLKSGADQTAADASTGELWYTDSHATLPDGVLMMGL